jgi:hypothetical protein
MIQSRLATMIQVDTMRSPSMPMYFVRIPPIAGPMRNAVPKAAHIIPIFFVFSAGEDISEI